MRVTFLLLAALVLSQVAFGQDLARYRILEGRLHRGGAASVEVMANESFRVRINYELVKKPLVPIPSDALKGDATVDLPELFRDERGYLELEAKGSMSLPDGEIRFLRRTRWGAFSDAYLVEVLPESGRARVEAVYHPSVPGAGWAQLRITFTSKVPLLNGYLAELQLR